MTTVKNLKADISSISLSSEWLEELWIACATRSVKYCYWPESSTQGCILVLTSLCDFQVDVTRWYLWKLADNFEILQIILKSWKWFQTNCTTLQSTSFSTVSSHKLLVILSLIWLANNFLLKFNCVTINQILFQIIILHYSKRRH